ncbi:MAG TPA: hypothetical protein VFF53_12230, partial [Geobacteraceae bacterium]|nr:hypothetical protein [Geobacteraceae bacterium]
SKPISGFVADPATGLPVANAAVTAYAIGADGTVATTPLSVPATVRSDAQGSYTLNIPLGYGGGIMVVATLPDGSQIRSVIQPVTGRDIPPAMVNLASEMVAQYIDQNLAGSFTRANVQSAVLVLEPFFGTDFFQISPPANGTTPNTLQQNMLAMTQAINVLTTTGINGHTYTIGQLVTVTGGNIAMGQDPALTDLRAALVQVSNNLISNGTLPGTYTPPTITPIPVPPPPTDITPPSAPANLKAEALSSSEVNLSWDAAAAAEGVTFYLVYRNGIFIANVAAPTVTFTDSGLAADTTYTYVLRARDAASNLSNASNQATAITKPATITPTFTISGTITVDGSKPSPGTVVPLTISGDGSGIAFTDADGNYSFTGAIDGKTYTITPSLVGFVFTPESQTITINNANVTGVNFATTTPIPGTVIGGVVYPDGIVIGGVTYPPGTIVGGVTYPSGIVIGGVTYPTATVVGGVTYPTGTVIGGTTYPNGVVIGGIAYPPGTVVGGIAYPPGAVTSGVTFSSGSITASILFP